MDAFTGEIRIFAGVLNENAPPDGWAYCDGRLLNVSEYPDLLTLIGTAYGGDGIKNFALPNLDGRVAVGASVGEKPAKGRGVETLYAVGDHGGIESVTLTTSQIPSHDHTVYASTKPATTNRAGQAVTFAAVAPPAEFYDAKSTVSGANANYNPQAIGMSGGNQSHSNIMPTTVLKYIICLNGEYPIP